MSGRYAGPVSRVLAVLVDWFFLTFVYGLFAASLSFILNRFFDLDTDFGGKQGIWWFVGLGVWMYLYSFVSLALTGRTLGKGLLGLRVVERDGDPLLARSALIRSLVLPISFIIPLGLVGAVLGRERRTLHDVAAGSVVVYDWGDRPAEMPSPLARFIERRGVTDPTKITSAADGT